MSPPVERDELGRPVIDRALLRLVADMAEKIPELHHVDGGRILFVAGAARLSSRASIRPLTYGGDPPSRRGTGHIKPIIELKGVSMLYEICLRPRFFLEPDPRRRITVVAHELWHCSDRFDGALSEERRHEVAGDAIERAVERMIEGYLGGGIPPAARFLEDTTEMRMRAWLQRPPTRIPLRNRPGNAPRNGSGASVRTRYDERDLFLSVVGGDLDAVAKGPPDD